ncbi:MAG TPA: PIG-L family deacetylase, partial [candidate division Zixibacteria bacterium]|nr:PIG-L family deacetylase [candidate division Zixibacteria bacterium]
FGTATESPGLEVVGRARETELRQAAALLGVREVNLLDYIDGEVDRAPAAEAAARIAALIRRHRPQVVMTFGPEGAYGHPDHIAISQYCGAGIVAAADAGAEDPAGGLIEGAAHRVSKLYYMAWTAAQMEGYQAAFKRLVSVVDGVERQATPCQDWLITTRIDATERWRTVWQAVLCHKTQMAVYQKLAELDERYHKTLWGDQTFYRVFSLVNGGRAIETDLFDGLR